MVASTLFLSEDRFLLLGWMKASKLRLTPDKMKVLLVGKDSVLGRKWEYRDGGSSTPSEDLCS